MARNDIYDNKARYLRFIGRLEQKTLPPEQRNYYDRRAKYQIKNPANLEYFKRLMELFEAQDLSYINRYHRLAELLLAAHVVEKDFKDCTREDLDKVMAFMHKHYLSAKTKANFAKNLRYTWKQLFPVHDEKGLIDEGAYPHVVRHISTKIDRSQERMRGDRLTWDEFERIMAYFGKEPRVQAYIMLAMESLGRPQELLTRKIKNVEMHDCYAKVWLTEHGKEGPGLLQCIDAYPYLARWLEVHPEKHNPEAWLFVNTGAKGRGQQMRPSNVNRLLKEACKALGINGKSVTGYSLKRNGVTFRRVRGDSDMEIQHAARWTSPAVLRIYDFSQQEDAMKRELIKRGIIEPENGSSIKDTQARICIYCGASNGFTADFCSNCKRPLARDRIKGHIESVEALKRQMEEQRDKMAKQQQEIEDMKIAARVVVASSTDPHVADRPRDKEYFKDLIREMISRGEVNLR